MSTETISARDNSEGEKLADLPRWLENELRSDHAGETGAVAIYRGILAVSHHPDIRDFASRHIVTEQQHLRLMGALLPPPKRSRLLPIWTLAGLITGALPALISPNAVYATIDAVETFVDSHYQKQIDRIADDQRLLPIGAALEDCRRDEVLHRDEARQAQRSRPGVFLRSWLWAVANGSAVAVAVARRI